MEDYEVKAEENQKRNKKYLQEFEKWLINKNLVQKTIRKHLNNMDFYLNDYLNYYDAVKMEDGIGEAYGFLGDWFIRKCLFASKTSLQEYAASVKKFYQCMSELNYVSKEDYKFLAKVIKDNMDEFLSTLEDYDNDCFDDYI